MKKNIKLKNDKNDLSQLRLPCQIHNPYYEIKITHRKKIKKNHKAPLPINLMLNVEIKKKNYKTGI